MSRVTVSTTIDTAPDRLWEVLSDIAHHVDWMEDAVAIRFTSDRTEGVGTEFDCDTRIGPFRLVDHMEITEWSPGRAMGVRHVGLVTGTGAFTLRTVGGDAEGPTRFTWTERLTFPWWMGGPVGALVAAPVLRRVWRTNLDNLARIAES